MRENSVPPVKKQRNSNVELLRIVSMFLIILYHIFRRYSVYNGSFSTLPAHVYLTETVLGIWGTLGVYLFVSISAWFQNDAKFKIRHIIDILFQCFCYVAIYKVIEVVIRYKNSLSLFNIVKFSILGIHDAFVFKNAHWFVAPFIMMCFMSPFLNLIQQKLSKVQMQTLLITWTGLWVYSNLAGSFFSSSTMFLYVYMLIGYLKKYCMEEQSKRFVIWGGCFM